MRHALVALVLLAVAGCAGDSAFPEATGKGTIRMINAIKGSPDIGFFIEERFLGNVQFKSSSGGQRFDDFSYIFNFEVQFIGETERRRVASPTLKVDPNRDYTFVLTGAVDAPTTTIWERDEHVFDGTETTFKVQLAHVAPSVGSVDVYLAPEGTAPVLGEERGTLNFGEVLDAIDVEVGEYVFTVTTAGDPNDILFQSIPGSFIARQSYFVPLFDGDENDTAPLTSRILNTAGGTFALGDARFPPTIRFIHASDALGNVDIYDDEMLTSLVLPDLGFGEDSGDIDAPFGTSTYRYTPVGNTGTELAAGGLTANTGTHFNQILVDTTVGAVAQTVPIDRRTILTWGKLIVYPAAENHERLDLYVVDRGVPLAPETVPFTTIIYTLAPPNIALTAGSHDLYLTVSGEQTVVAGPVEFDIALGQFIETIVIDDVDPNTATVVTLPNP